MSDQMDKSWLKRALPEFLSIVFAVTLALLLNEWRQQWREQQLVDRIIVTLTDETRTNLSDLERALAYRNRLLANIESGLHIVHKVPIDELDFDPMDDAALAEGVRAAIMSDGRYESELEVLRANGDRLLRLGRRVARVVMEKDTLYLYGDFSLQLRSASLRMHTWDLATATGALAGMDYDVVRLMTEIKALSRDYASTVDKALTLLYTGEGDPINVMMDMQWMERQLVEQNRSLLQALEQK